MGHANIRITFDLYGHLFPCSEAEAAGLLDCYMQAQLEAAAVAAQDVGSEPTGASTGARVAGRAQEAHV
jgi:hypothetical protein